MASAALGRGRAERGRGQERLRKEGQRENGTVAVSPEAIMASRR